MKYAVCSEIFVEGAPQLKDLVSSRFWPLERMASTAADLGYGGLEIAPFTLDRRPTEITANHRKAMNSIIQEAGLQTVGLHWLLSGTQGLHLTSPDPAVREKTAEYVRNLADLCADLGGSIMVWGSPAQRSLLPEVSMQEAIDYAIDVWNQILPRCAERNVTIAIEPLSPAETDFINTAAQAVSIIQKVDHPNLRLHLDTKAMSYEDKPVHEVVREFVPWTAHFHANDPNLKGPGAGDLDHRPIAAELRGAYNGWVSVEVFDFAPDPVTIAGDAIRYLREVYA
jgi:sugar phosphate isomerase/epimerase